MTELSAARWCSRAGALAVLVSIVVASCARPNTRNEQNAAIDVYQRAAPSIVEILVNGAQVGTGWVSSESGRIATASHLFVRFDQDVSVRTLTGGTVSANLEAVYPECDLAILRTARQLPLPPLVWAADPPVVGSQIQLIASQRGRHPSLIPGTVSLRGTAAAHPGCSELLRATDVSASVQPGTSGGPWIDANGHVIGVQVGRILDGNSHPTGGAYMAESPGAGRSTGSRRDVFRVGMSGARLARFPASTVARYGGAREGVVVMSLVSDGPAARAGLRVRDLVFQVGGSAVADGQQLLNRLQEFGGGMAAIEILRPDGSGRAESLELDVPVLHIDDLLHVPDELRRDTYQLR